MKSRMKVGEKGQIVIPKTIREQTGIKEGTEVVFEAKSGTAMTSEGRSSYGELRRLFHDDILQENSTTRWTSRNYWRRSDWTPKASTLTRTFSSPP